MGKKSEYAASAEVCEQRARQALHDEDATEWFGLAMYWTVLSRGVRPEDQEDHFITRLHALGTGQRSSRVLH